VAGRCVSTPNDDLCADDGVFCNGEEVCDAEEGCVSTGDPCPGEICNEQQDRCVECTDDADCDDGLYCNGAERCAGGSCQAGTPPCESDQTCDEQNDACQSGLSISGRVTRHDGNPYAGVPLHFSGRGEWSATDFTTATRLDGTYEVVVPVGWTGNATSTEDYRLSPDEREYEDLRLGAGGENYAGFRNWYVDDDGDRQPNFDPNAPLGTFHRPYELPTSLVAVVAPGDTVYLREGGYTYSGNGGDWVSYLSVPSGTAAAPITWRNYERETAILDGAGKASAVIGIGTGKGYVVLEGLHVTGSAPNGSLKGGIVLYAAHHVTIRGCTIFENGGIGVRLLGNGGTPTSDSVIERCTIYRNLVGVRTNVAGGATIAARDCTVRYCNVYDQTRVIEDADGIHIRLSQNIRVEYCVVHDNADDNVDIFDSSDCVLTGNVAYNAGLLGPPGDGNGFKVGVQGGRRHVLRGNISFRNARTGFDNVTAVDNEYYNNLAFSNGTFGIAIRNCIARNNVSYGNAQQFWYGGGGDLSHNFWSGQDPRWVNTQNPGVRLDIESPDFGRVPGFVPLPNSPLIDAGTDVGQGYPPADGDGNGSKLYDIGPYEYTP
jgi:parallel beta-helix repeat protein